MKSPPSCLAIRYAYKAVRRFPTCIRPVGLLMLAKAGKKNGCLIEGMACPGGCVAGAGTNIAIPAAARAVGSFKNAAGKKIPDQS